MSERLAIEWILRIPIWGLVPFAIAKIPFVANLLTLVNGLYREHEILFWVLYLALLAVYEIVCICLGVAAEYLGSEIGLFNNTSSDGDNLSNERLNVMIAVFLLGVFPFYLFMLHIGTEIAVVFNTKHVSAQ